MWRPPGRLLLLYKDEHTQKLFRDAKKKPISISIFSGSSRLSRFLNKVFDKVIKLLVLISSESMFGSKKRDRDNKLPTD